MAFNARGDRLEWNDTDRAVVHMQTIDITDISELLDHINRLLVSREGIQWVFRGQGNAEWSVASTLSRFSTNQNPHFEHAVIRLLVDQFVEGLVGVGQRDLMDADRRTKLEMARHYDVPSPLIDFSFSPLVALWFAFNGIGDVVRSGKEQSHYAALYAFDAENGGRLFDSRLKATSDGEKLDGLSPFGFFYPESPTLFDASFPLGVLKFIGLTSPFNTRMQRQQGCFIYDTMHYKEFGAECFDEFFGDDAIVGDSQGKPRHVLIKYRIPASLRHDIFDYLHVMGINGARLLEDHTGVAADVKNVFNHSPRQRFWHR